MWRYLFRGQGCLGSFAEIVLAFTDFLEAEARALRAGVLKLATSAMLIMASLIFVLAGFLFIFWGFYLLFSWALHSAIGGAFLTGAIALVISALLVGIALARVKK